MKDRITQIDPYGLYNFKTARKLLRVSIKKMSELIKTGKIKAKKIGKEYKILGQNIIDFLKEIE
ncbi:MAG: helix-turn-helix domain-containing protein [Candidatus Micrarchaeia archaeon]